MKKNSFTSVKELPVMLSVSQVAAVLNIRMRHALPAILLGLVIAAAITTAVTLGLWNLLI